MNAAQNWALLGVVSTLATGLLGAVFTLHQSMRGWMGDLRASLGDLRGSMGDLRDLPELVRESRQLRRSSLRAQVALAPTNSGTSGEAGDQPGPRNR
jgi:hypothetical protein